MLIAAIAGNVIFAENFLRVRADFDNLSVDILTRDRF